MNKKELLDRCAHSGEERVLLARVLDKLELAQNRGVPAYTPFLSPGEQALTADLLAACGRPRHLFWGGYEGAERAVCAFLPDWQEEEDVRGDPEGMTREKLGDILLPGSGRCQVLLLRESLPILLSQWETAGRWRVRLQEIPLDQLAPAPPQVKTIRDTVASPRLDAVLAAGFSLSRSKAAAYISSGKAAVNHRECLKGDRQVEEGDVITCRGLGKCVVKEVPGQSRKGRTMLVLERYI